MKKYIKNHLFGIIYGFALVAFFTYAILDVFVIPHTYENVDGQEIEYLDSDVAVEKAKEYGLKLVSADNRDDANSSVSENADSNSTDSASENEAVSDNKAEDSVSQNEKPKFYYGQRLESTILDDADFLEIGTYSDENINIQVNRYRYCDTYVFVAEVYVSSPDYLKTAFAADTYGRNITKRTTEIAADKGAILAVNGDFYGARQTGYVVRNGILYRSDPNPRSQDLAILIDGSFGVFNEADASAESICSLGATQILSFGPALIVDGQVSVGERQEVAHASYSNPRTAIGMIDKCHYLFVVSDGRTDESKGLSLFELATFMQMGNCKMAYNLDGGGSSTMVFNGQLLNNPCPGYGYIVERSVSDIVYIGY